MFAAQLRPADSFAVIIKMARMCSAVVGADIANPKFRINWVTGVVFLSITGYFIFSINTIVEVFDEHPTFMLEASCMLGSVLQGIAKIVTGLVHTKIFVEIRFELEKLYAEYQLKGTEYCAALNQSCKRLRNIIKLFGIIYLMCAMGIILVPLCLLIFTGERYLLMHFLVPGLDIKTNFGYFGTMAAHFVCIYVGAFGLFAGDLFVLIYLTHCSLFADIFTLKIKDLNTCLDKDTAVPKLKYMLQDIIHWHTKYNDFNKTCNDLFYHIITVQITTSGISIVCTLFIVLNGGNWPGVYAYMVLPVVSLYTYCVLGTQITNCNDRFTCDIFSINWFLLPVQEQKLIRMMLMKSQRPAIINIVGVMPLNVSTALKISKTIYSIFMMMVKVLIKKQ